MKRIAIITGASSGMGSEFTKELFMNSENYKFGKFDEIWILEKNRHGDQRNKEKCEKGTFAFFMDRIYTFDCNKWWCFELYYMER